MSRTSMSTRQPVAAIAAAMVLGAIGRRLVAPAFTSGTGFFSLPPVPSQQLCSVAGPLWAPPYFFANGHAQLA